MSEVGRHGRNISWLILAEGLQKLLAAAYFIYLARTLSVVENGYYGIFAALFPIVVVLNGAGLYEVAVRDISQRRGHHAGLVSASLLILAAAALPIGALVWSAARLLDYPLELQRIVLLTTLAAVLFAMARLQHAILAACEQFKVIALLNILNKVIVVGGSVALLYFGYRVTALMVYLIPAHCIGILAACVFARRAFPAYTWSPSGVRLRYLLAEGTPIALGALAASAYFSADMFLITALGSEDSPGYFSIGFRFYMMLAMIPMLLASVTYPILSRKAVEPEADQRFALERCIKLSMIVALPAAVGVTLVGRPLVVTLLGERFIPSVPAVIVLTWVLAAEMFNRNLTVFFRARGRPNLPLAVYAGALIAKILLAFSLIPTYDIKGLLALNLILAAFCTVVLFRMAQSLLPSLRVWPMLQGALLRPAMAAAAMGAALWFIRDASIFLTIPAGAAVYAAVLLLVRTFDDFDKRMLRGTLGITGSEEGD